MAADKSEQTDRNSRRGVWQPYALLSPGVLWLVLFFVVPVATLVQIGLSEQKSRFTQDFSFAWKFSNFTNVIRDDATIFLRSFGYAGAATLLCIVIGYPMAYFIAFRGGRWRNLLLGLVIAPFFTSYLIRTIAWTTILGDNGPIVSLIDRLRFSSILNSLGVTENGHLLATRTAVIGGLTYNFLPFMILPMYVALEKIDPKLVDAAKDLFSSPRRAFFKIVFPLSLPGVFAGTLLTFIPASGDYVNSTYLGGPNNTMIGNLVQSRFLVENAYTTAAAMSLILMVIITIAVLVYTKLLGTEGLAV